MPARTAALLRLAATASTTRASSASAARRRLYPSSDGSGGEEQEQHAAVAREDELLPPPTHWPEYHDERRLPRRGEHRPGRHDDAAYPRAHMASGVLHRPAASLCLRPAAAEPAAPAGSGAVMIGDSRTQRGAALRLGGSSRRELLSVTMASRDHTGLTRQLLDFQHDTIDEVGAEHDPFVDLKARFLDFKQRNFVENFSNYQSLAQQQTPKFMVVACADSRVCPTAVLGFQPGEAFTVRNVANLVPPYEHGGSETSAALEFAVNTLQVENVLVVGHSRCGGIQALMSMKDDSTSGSFIKNWVSIGKSARLSTKAAAGNLSFEVQCKHCEKESINSSLLNLLTYPWIEKRVNEGSLNLHGGYYNFVDCTFEKWTLLYREGLEGGSKYAIKNRSTWS